MSCNSEFVPPSLLLTEVAGDKVRAAEAGEDDRDEDPEADHAHDDARPLRHGQVQLAPTRRHLSRISKKLGCQVERNMYRRARL